MFPQTYQEESRSISQNLRWAYQRRFRRGKVSVATKRFLGYDLGENGELVINEKEAGIVRQIFREYLAGKGMRNIAAGLTADRIKTVTCLARWPESTMRNVLANEKYCGDAVLQKTYVADYLTHRKRKNDGELPKFRVRGNHPPIVAKEDFESVQRLMAERAAEYGNLPGNREKYAG